MIYIVGLGYNKNEYSDEIKSLVEKYPVFVRSDWHPIIKELDFNYTSFDYIYERSDSFENVYNEIANILIEESKTSPVVYIVMGSANVAEKTVELLSERTEVQIIDGISFIEKIINYLRLDPIKNGLQIVDGLSDFSVDVNSDVIIAQVYSRLRASEVKLKLLEYYNDDTDIMILDSIGVIGKETKIECKLYELDRMDCFDHLTSVYIQRTNNRKFNIQDLDLSSFNDVDYVEEEVMAKKLLEVLKHIEFHTKQGYYDLSDLINIIKKSKKN